MWIVKWGEGAVGSHFGEVLGDMLRYADAIVAVEELLATRVGTARIAEGWQGLQGIP